MTCSSLDRIVNIDSTLNHQDNPVNIPLDAGTYAVEPIGIADGGTYDAWNAWPSTTCGDTNGCSRTDPTITGWVNPYTVLSTNIVSVSVEGGPLTPVLGVLDPLQHFFLATDLTPLISIKYRVEDGLAYPDALSALAKAQSSVFTLSSSGPVGFAIQDSPGALGDNSGGISLKVTRVPTEVNIDIKPGSDPNSINLSSAGVIPVAILGSETFDVTLVNPDTVALAGASVKMVGKSDKSLAHVEDVNEDGFPDLVCKVLTAQFMIEPGESIAMLEAELFDGTPIRGEDSINIVKDY